MGEKLSYNAALTKASGPPTGPLGHKEAAMALPSWPALQQGRLAFYSSRNWSIDQAAPPQTTAVGNFQREPKATGFSGRAPRSWENIGESVS